MSEGWHYSIVLLVPASDLDNANKVAAAMKHGPRNITLAAGTGEEITHWYCHSAGAQEFVDMVSAFGEGTPPDVDWSAVGLTFEEAMGVLSRMVISIRDGGDSVQHASDTLTANGLQPVTVQPVFPVRVSK